MSHSLGAWKAAFRIMRTVTHEAAVDR